MKLRELYQESSLLNERNPGTALILSFFNLYYIAKPIYAAHKNIGVIQSRFNNHEAGMTPDKKAQLIEHELAQCAAQIAAALVGSSLLKNITTELMHVFGMNMLVRELLDFGVAWGQVKYMQWINSEEGRNIIAKWLTGQYFHAIGIIKDTGPLFDKYMGRGIKHALEDADKKVKQTVKQVTGNPETPGVQSVPVQPIKTIPIKPYVDAEIDPSDPEAIPHINVKRGAF